MSSPLSSPVCPSWPVGSHVFALWPFFATITEIDRTNRCYRITAKEGAPYVAAFDDPLLELADDDAACASRSGRKSAPIHAVGTKVRFSVWLHARVTRVPKSTNGVYRVRFDDGFEAFVNSKQIQPMKAIENGNKIQKEEKHEEIREEGSVALRQSGRKRSRPAMFDVSEPTSATPKAIKNRGKAKPKKADIHAIAVPDTHVPASPPRRTARQWALHQKSLDEAAARHAHSEADPAHTQTDQQYEEKIKSNKKCNEVSSCISPDTLAPPAPLASSVPSPPSSTVYPPSSVCGLDGRGRGWHREKIHLREGGERWHYTGDWEKICLVEYWEREKWLAEGKSEQEIAAIQQQWRKPVDREYNRKQQKIIKEKERRDVEQANAMADMLNHSCDIPSAPQSVDVRALGAASEAAVAADEREITDLTGDDGEQTIAPQPAVSSSSAPPFTLSSSFASAPLLAEIFSCPPLDGAQSARGPAAKAKAKGGDGVWWRRLHGPHCTVRSESCYRQHGQGVSESADHSVVKSGTFYKGALHGPACTIKDECGTYRGGVERDVENDQDGEFVFHTTDDRVRGRIKDGIFVAGRLDYGDASQGIYEGELAPNTNGVSMIALNGYGRMWWPNGSANGWREFVGGHLDNLWFGPGRLVTTDGRTFEGEWNMEKLNRQATVKWTTKDWATNPATGAEEMMDIACVYRGGVKDYELSGIGELTWSLPDGSVHSVYQGEFTRGLMDGYGIRTWSNGNRYEGDWVAGACSGYGHWLKKDTGDGLGDVVYKGRWVDDKEHGDGELENNMAELGRVKFVGAFVHGWLNGFGRVFLTDDQEERRPLSSFASAPRLSDFYYEGQFNHGVFDGHGVLNTLDGETFYGQFKAGNFHGLGKMLDTRAASCYTGRFKDDFKHGLGLLVYYQYKDDAPLAEPVNARKDAASRRSKARPAIPPHSQSHSHSSDSAAFKRQKADFHESQRSGRHRQLSSRAFQLPSSFGRACEQYKAVWRAGEAVWRIVAAGAYERLLAAIGLDAEQEKKHKDAARWKKEENEFIVRLDRKFIKSQLLSAHEQEKRAIEESRRMSEGQEAVTVIEPIRLLADEIYFRLSTAVACCLDAGLCSAAVTGRLSADGATSYRCEECTLIEGNQVELCRACVKHGCHSGHRIVALAESDIIYSVCQCSDDDNGGDGFMSVSGCATLAPWMEEIKEACDPDNNITGNASNIKESCVVEESAADKLASSALGADGPAIIDLDHELLKPSLIRPPPGVAQFLESLSHGPSQAQPAARALVSRWVKNENGNWEKIQINEAAPQGHEAQSVNQS